MSILGGSHHFLILHCCSRRRGFQIPSLTTGFLGSSIPVVCAGFTIAAGGGGARKERGRKAASDTSSPLPHQRCVITLRAGRLSPSFLPSGPQNHPFSSESLAYQVHMIVKHEAHLSNASSSSSSGACMAAIDSTAAYAEEPNEPQVAKGYTLTQFCDKMIDVFLHDNPRPKHWRRLLIFRNEWKRYRKAFYTRCKKRADAEQDNSLTKRKLVDLERKVRKIDNEMERHFELLDEIQNNPTDINAIVARRRKDFTGDFFHHLNILSQVNDTLEDRDAMTRLGAKCLSAVSAYDYAAENVEMLDKAQSKFDDILNSPSLGVACEKIRSLAKAKELDSSLVLLINRSWAAAKDSPTMKSTVKDIMYHIYKATKSCLRSIAPKEIKLLKYLLNITDPEERFSALASAFSPRNEHEIKDKEFLNSTPEELHKWIKIMLDAYQLNKEETQLREARNMTDPVVIQRLFILKETVEEEYLKRKLRHEASEELKPEE